MKNYRSEQVTKYLLRYMYRGGRKFRNIKLDRRKFKLWLKQQREFKEWLEQQIKREEDEG